jgi:hypothetical protein
MKHLTSNLHRNRHFLYCLLAVVLFSCNQNLNNMKFRIVKNELGYYPQVKTSFFWNKIAEHPTGYGLYPKSDINYPKTEKECEQIIEGYKIWCLKSKGLTVVKNYR